MSDHLQACPLPLEVTRVDDEVAITGPDGVAISLTREAAAISGRRLLDASGDGAPGETYQKPLG